tara:strand:- start:1124 stop:2320 length:1197 start_codon:yes stop_codon:yes gene_type:complete
MKVYLVGGAVRDKLLGMPSKDNDWVVVGESSKSMLSAGFDQVGTEFPVFLHPITKEEYALARTERKSGRGYKGFEVIADKSVSLEDDLSRRDLTINAIAETPEGIIIDPFDGQGDLKRKLLRHISDAFVEDPLRVLRVAKFAARLEPLGFSVANETKLLMQKITTNGELQDLTAERVWLEISEGLNSQRPDVFISVLQKCGALAFILPEIEILFDAPCNPTSKTSTSFGTATLQSLRRARELKADLPTIYGALVYNVGKQTGSDHKLNFKLTEKIANRLRVPKSCQQVATLVSRHQDELSRATTLNAKELLQFIDSLDAKRRPDRLEKFFLACKANVTSSENDPDSFLTQIELIRVLIKKINDINWKTLLVDQNDTNREVFITAKKLSIVSDHIAQHA